jgi:Predicted secreted protein
MTTKITGAAVLVKVDTNPTGNANYVTIGSQKSATLNMTQDAVDVSNKDTPLWRDYIPGYREWSVDCDAMIVETDAALVQLESQYIAGTPVRVAIQTPANSQHWSGTGLIKSMKYSAADGGVYSAALTIQGTGALAKQ